MTPQIDRLREQYQACIARQMRPTKRRRVWRWVFGTITVITLLLVTLNAPQIWLAVVPFIIWICVSGQTVVEKQLQLCTLNYLAIALSVLQEHGGYMAYTDWLMSITSATLLPAVEVARITKAAKRLGCIDGTLRSFTGVRLNGNGQMYIVAIAENKPYLLPTKARKENQ